MRERVRTIVMETLGEAVFGGEPPPSEAEALVVEQPKDASHGDMATNAAMVLARPLGRPPRELAEAIQPHLAAHSDFFESVEVAGPGFINFRLAGSLLRDEVRAAVAAGPEYGRSNVGQGRPVQVEFVSANPTGPLHVGHGRGAAVGDVLASLLEAAGFAVHREYYINDVGTQMELLGRSTYSRYCQALGRDEPLPEDGYQGAYLADIARQLVERDGPVHLGEDPEAILPAFTAFAAESILRGIEADLRDFGVLYDRWFSEQGLFETGRVDRALQALEKAGYLYERDGARWFNSSALGDEKDRVVVRETGRPTYLAGDIAYHQEKYERGFEIAIDVWGADHHGHVPRIKAAMKALGRDPEAFHVVLVQFVTLLRGGEPVSMSTRAGEFVTLREVMEEVGRDAARFFFLMRRSDSHLDFDLELAKQQTSENPVYYVQYAHTRICSILREAQAREVAMPDAASTDLEALRLVEERALMVTLIRYRDLVADAAKAYEPHRLVFYLQELAAQFHQYYNLGNTDPAARVLGPDAAVTAARLVLAQAVRQVLANALELLGVAAPEAM
ncbi:MAG: arginine--tRNA ligase [bacterium]|nr:arginine--tRNA ligase [bacterium]